jgi:hypothetical protein
MSHSASFLSEINLSLFDRLSRIDGKATFTDFADLTIENAGEHADKIREAWTLVGYPFPEKRHEL